MMEEVHDRLQGFWDRDAATYDRSPAHAASDPVEAAAWRAALARHLPTSPASVLDVGAGTGSISVLVAEMGHRVTALDLSPAMLAKAREKAAARGLVIATVTGPASEPPPGPFEAIVARHLMWTLPAPAEALAAWRAVAPRGRLVLFEGIFARQSLGWRARGKAANLVRTLRSVPSDHHGAYDPGLLASLPLAGASSPALLVEAVDEAGWRRIRLERLRDVEWARRMAAPVPLGLLEGVPQFALVADDVA